MNNLEFRVPKNEDEFNEYDLFRWRLLRKPIGKTMKVSPPLHGRPW